MATSSIDDRSERSVSSRRGAAGVAGVPHPTDPASPTVRVLRLERSVDRSLSYAALVARAQQAEGRNRPLTARRLYELALGKLSEASSGADAADLLRRIARTHRRETDLQLSVDCAEAALAVAEAHAHAEWLRDTTNFLGGLRVQLGDLDEAERLYRRAHDCAMSYGQPGLAAAMTHNLGIIANIRGDFLAAAARYEESLAAFRVLDMARERGAVLCDLGNLHTQAARWEDSARAYDEAMHVAEQQGDRNTQLLIEVRRIEAGVARGDLDAADAAVDRAKTLARSTRDMPARGAAWLACGIVARERGEHQDAERMLGRACDLAMARDDVLLLADATRELAELFRRQGRNRDALRSLNRAGSLFAGLRARREMAEVSRRTGVLEDDFLQVARRWGRSMECTDLYTQGHSERVAEIACALALADGMDRQTLFWFRIGALLHDVGKLALPAGVLSKAGPLSAEEWGAVRDHPVQGVELLADIEFPWDVRPIVESHHERWDGAGYPHRLAGEAIPRVARIVAIADVYDALTSARSYKAPLSHPEAIAVMRADSGRQFDPALFALFEQVAAAHADAWVLQARVGSQAAPAAMTERRTARTGERTQRVAEHDAASALSPMDACRFRRVVDDEQAGLRGSTDRRAELRAVRDRRVPVPSRSISIALPTAVRPLLARLMHDRMLSSRARLFNCRDVRAFRLDAHVARGGLPH
ncbi:MAG: diguanylate cyclase [Gemmatimonadetes bacterium]|nr:diguanylate cyclase [Gemmatimonadota bacterium]